MATNPKFCRNCDISKVDRAPYRDKVLKREGKEILLEQLGFNCRRCNRPLIQLIDYTKSGRQRIKWKKL